MTINLQWSNKINFFTISVETYHFSSVRKLTITVIIVLSTMKFISILIVTRMFSGK